MIIAPNGPIVYCDVDSTLVGWDEESDVKVQITCNGISDYYSVNIHVVDYIIKLAKRGHIIIIHTKAETNWGVSVVKALGIEEYVYMVISKPKYYVDDIKDPTKWMGEYKYINFDGVDCSLV